MAKGVKRDVNKARKKKPRIKNDAELELMRMYGFPPTFDGKSVEDADYTAKLMNALNWCNRGLDTKDGRKELALWMESNGYTAVQVKAVKKLPENDNQIDGKLAYLINNNWPMAADMMERMKARITKAVVKGKAYTKQTNVEEVKQNSLDELRKQNEVSTYEQNTIDAYEIVDFVEDELFTNFTLDETKLRALAKDKKKMVLDVAIGKIKDFQEEMNLVGTDDDLTRAHNNLKKTQVKNIVAGLDNALRFLEGTKINKTATRKPRVKKAKSAAAQIKNFKYKPEDKDFNIVSTDPMSIIGQTKLVVFNTKTRKLGIYYAKDATGFSIKGTTLLNVDEELSEQKTLRGTKARSIQDALVEFRKAPVKRVDRLFQDINTTNIKLTGRVNADTVLLKVYK